MNCEEIHSYGDPLLYFIKKSEYIAVYQIISPSLRSREGNGR
jgi:hypothetical protein